MLLVAFSKQIHSKTRIHTQGLSPGIQIAKHAYIPRDCPQVFISCCDCRAQGARPLHPRICRTRTVVGTARSRGIRPSQPCVSTTVFSLRSTCPPPATGGFRMDSGQRGSRCRCSGTPAGSRAGSPTDNTRHGCANSRHGTRGPSPHLVPEGPSGWNVQSLRSNRGSTQVGSHAGQTSLARSVASPDLGVLSSHYSQ
jgi:hypothetical protein